MAQRPLSRRKTKKARIAGRFEVLEKLRSRHHSAAWVAANFFSQSLELGSAANGFFRPKAVQAIARAKSWAVALSDEKYVSVEELAASAKLHADSGSLSSARTSWMQF
jgi:hypothetical protein